MIVTSNNVDDLSVHIGRGYETASPIPLSYNTNYKPSRFLSFIEYIIHEAVETIVRAR